MVLGNNIINVIIKGIKLIKYLNCSYHKIYLGSSLRSILDASSLSSSSVLGNKSRRDMSGKEIKEKWA